MQMVDLKNQYLRIKDEIDNAIKEVTDSCKFINGPQVREFAEDLAAYTGAKYVIPVANGTDALQISLMALGLKPGDEVIVPSFTYIASAEVIALLNLVPVMVDVNYDSFNTTAENFERAILHGLEFASKSDKLITIGIKPTRPETGYGYIQIDEEKEEDFYKVKTFIEKPALEFAEIFVQSNEFYWNSGIFIWHVNTILKAFHDMMSEVCPHVECDTPDFSACPNISIDYSIMEKADNVYVQLCDFGWADLGTWEALYDASPKDSNQNVIINSNTLLYNCKNNIIILPEDKLAVIQDLEGYLIAARGNALLICKKDDQNAIRKFVNDAEMKFGEKYS